MPTVFILKRLILCYVNFISIKKKKKKKARHGVSYLYSRSGGNVGGFRVQDLPELEKLRNTKGLGGQL
jgi:hypothetical protein